MSDTKQKQTTYIANVHSLLFTMCDFITVWYREKFLLPMNDTVIHYG